MAAIVAQLEKVSRMFGRFPALRHVSTAFEAGRCYVLLGENGAGKSTLLRILAGLLQPSAGTVRVFAEDLAAHAHRPELRARVGYMSHSPMLYDELSASENLRYFADLYRTTPCLTPQEALRLVALDPALSRPVGQYSQGMRQRTSLARVLLPQPELVLLDEPFSNMDVASARQMVALLAGWRATQRTVVLTTHQREVAAPLADYFLTMEAGRLISVDAGPALERSPDSWAEARPV
jgi:heme ABC exporter ATP-binding subunit CcmA